MKICFCMRGIMGSFKSTIAKKLAVKHNATIVSADLYFTDAEGIYRFDATKLGAAHRQCQDEFELLTYDRKNVIVDNTNLNDRDLNHYKDLALAEGYLVVVVEPSIHDEIVLLPVLPTGSLFYEHREKLRAEQNEKIARLLTKRNVHKVSYEVIRSRVDNWRPFAGSCKFKERYADATYYYVFPVDL